MPLRQAVLFGSFARNEQHEYSDIDLALVADTFTGAALIDIKPFIRFLVRHVDIEPHTFSPEQFTDGNPFVQEIKRTGIVVGEWWASGGRYGQVAAGVAPTPAPARRPGGPAWRLSVRRKCSAGCRPTPGRAS